jgi:hypothetical protein
MFTHPAAKQEALARRNKLTSAEQWCSECDAWAPVPLDTLRAYLETFAAAPASVSMQPSVGIPVKFFVCANQHTLTVLLPGEYDPLRGGSYSVQRYGFADDASIGANRVPKPTLTNLRALASAVATATDGIIGKVAPTDAPHLKRCIAAGLLEWSGPGQWRLSSAGVAALARPR